MSIINLNRKYQTLVTFGCSFSDGWIYGRENAWGQFLSELLGCEHFSHANSGSSNSAILNNIIRYCEHHEMKDKCVGIQWSEWSRREMWSKTNNEYFTFNLSTFTNLNNLPSEIEPFRDNIDLFTDVWFDNRENILRTIQTMILTKHYLTSKNIDYIMFEGLGSIFDEYYPSKEIEKLLSEKYRISSDLLLLKDEYRLQILKDKEFFSKYGDMRTHMKTKNIEGHPTPEYSKWWSEEIYNYLKEMNV